MNISTIQNAIKGVINKYGDQPITETVLVKFNKTCMTWLNQSGCQVTLLLNTQMRMEMKVFWTMNNGRC